MLVGMVHLYRRHKDTCKFAGNPYHKGCKCPIWMRGVIDGKAVKESMRLRSWERAEKKKREIEAPPEEKKPEPVTFERAKQFFIANLEGEGRQKDTIRKYRLLFAQLQDFALSNGLYRIQDFGFEQLVAFRSSWAEKGVNTRNKKLDRLKAFFAFCHDAGMVLKNPATAIKPARAPNGVVRPFTSDEQAKILAKPQTAKYRAFVHVLYHSGLRISDCCFLKPDDFDGNCIRRVNRKNQVEIFVPLPPYLKAELDSLPLSGGYYFLIGESENLHTQTDAWRTVLSDLFKSDIPGFHPHRFRHTRVVEWLAAGITLEEISGMIGTSQKVLEKHYASFAPARQKVVSEKLGRIWSAKPKLMRVK